MLHKEVHGNNVADFDVLVGQNTLRFTRVCREYLETSFRTKGTMSSPDYQRFRVV
jgi:hypothetical protein